MAEAWFYHLTRSPVEVTLTTLLTRSLKAGWRVVLRGTEPQRMEWLDDRLWLGDKEDFLPHGLAGGPHDALQPVLLTTGPGLANDPACLMAIDGAEVGAPELAGLQRACILFDGNAPQAVQRARDQWRALTGAGIAAQYWAEGEGRWEMRARSDQAGS